jgi:phospholipase C
MDGWLRSHIASDSDTSGPYTMSYYEEADIPFQYALANAFTICGNYFCSVLGPTHPNRYMWMTGTVDPTGAHNGPALDNSITNGLYSWLTMAEILQNNGVSWKCYQQLYSTNTAGTQPSSGATLSSLLRAPPNCHCRHSRHPARRRRLSSRAAGPRSAEADGGFVFGPQLAVAHR